ncbi:MAG: DUF4139 domain-containing protein [Myxococcales bacterium]|nr:DUF4139 domain-containing protein [Myxococcales bacterium]
MSDSAQTMMTRIERVTVYRNGALVERVGRAGVGPIRVAGLPLLLAADSVRVRPAAGRVVDLRETCAVERRGPAGRAESAEAIERLVQALEGIDAEARALDARIDVYTDLAPTAPQGPALPSTELLLAMHETAGERLTALEARRVDLRDRRRTLERQLEAARAVVHADPEPPRFTRGLRFTLADAPGEVEVVVEYFVEAARWVPSYRLDLAAGEASLRLDALVAQASGEDWDGAALRFGTADLDRSTALPALDSWRIGTASSRRLPFRPLPGDLPGLFSGYDQGRAQTGGGDDEVDTRVQIAREDTTGTFRAEEETRTVVRASPLPPPGPPPPPPAMAPMPIGAAMPAPGMANDMAALAQSAPAPMMKRGGRPMAFGGAGGGGMAEEPVLDLALGGAAPPGGEGPRSLRFAWLRLRGPDEPGRGTLVEVDPLTQLWSLVEDHEVAEPELLARAVVALRQARARLRNAPTPQGTRPTDDGFHHVYQAGGLHDVPGDGFWHRAVVRADAAPAEVSFRAVPRETRDVFRFCSIRTPDGVPYPAGPMQVYIDGTFRVTAPLTSAGDGSPLELNLGLDRAVRVVDRVADVVQQDKGLVTHTTHVVHTVTLKLRSTLAAPAAVVIYDRLPVPAPDEREIEVSLLDADPAVDRTDRGPDDARLLGGLRWRLTLPPQGERTIVWRYRVALPAKAELSGGNRRE